MGENGKTILHVEDDPNDVLLIGRALRKAEVSASIQVVNDGDQAVDYLNGSNAYAQREPFPLPALVLWSARRLAPTLLTQRSPASLAAP